MENKCPPFDKLPKTIQRYIQGDITVVDALRICKKYSYEELKDMMWHYPQACEFKG